MRVSPLDIRKQEFTKAFRGFEVEEVNAFLQMLAREWEEMRDDNRRLEEQIRGLEEKIRHYERVEEALQEALQTARDSSKKAVDNAEERARLIVKNAESKASEITRDARDSLEEMRNETTRLANRQHEIIARLRAFLTAETEMLNRFERNEIASPSPRPQKVEMQERRQPTAASSKREDPPRPRQVVNVPVDHGDEYDDDDGEEDVFNPAADGEEDVQPIKAGSFNVRSLIASARAIEADEDDDADEYDRPGGTYGADRTEDISPQYDDDDDVDGPPGDAAGGKQATEEIEKIRRILNDLD